MIDFADILSVDWEVVRWAFWLIHNSHAAAAEAATIFVFILFFCSMEWYNNGNLGRNLQEKI